MILLLCLFAAASCGGDTLDPLSDVSVEISSPKDGDVFDTATEITLVFEASGDVEYTYYYIEVQRDETSWRTCNNCNSGAEFAPGYIMGIRVDEEIRWNIGRITAPGAYHVGVTVYNYRYGDTKHATIEVR